MLQIYAISLMYLILIFQQIFLSSQRLKCKTRMRQRICSYLQYCQDKKLFKRAKKYLKSYTYVCKPYTHTVKQLFVQLGQKVRNSRYASGCRGSNTTRLTHFYVLYFRGNYALSATTPPLVLRKTTQFIFANQAVTYILDFDSFFIY